MVIEIQSLHFNGQDLFNFYFLKKILRLNSNHLFDLRINY